jgi:hypothetical protein
MSFAALRIHLRQQKNGLFSRPQRLFSSPTLPPAIKPGFKHLKDEVKHIKDEVKHIKEEYLSSQHYMDEALGSKVWLSDPGTFPIITIVGFATLGCVSFFCFNVASNPEIRIRKDKRKATIRWWGGD